MQNDNTSQQYVLFRLLLQCRSQQDAKYGCYKVAAEMCYFSRCKQYVGNFLQQRALQLKLRDKDAQDKV